VTVNSWSRAGEAARLAEKQARIKESNSLDPIQCGEFMLGPKQRSIIGNFPENKKRKGFKASVHYDDMIVFFRDRALSRRSPG
jgi:hypothetical protein